MQTQKDNVILYNFPMNTNHDHFTSQKWLYDYQINYQIRSNEIENYLQNRQLSHESLQLRQNIRILIIVGSSLDYENFFHNGKQYAKIIGYEDFSSAFFISHLFQYAYGIPKSQILITSSEESNFFSLDQKPPISPDSKNPSQSDEPRNSIFQKEFIDTTFHGLIYTQIGTKCYYFFEDQEIKDVIHPFNSYTLQRLNVNSNSELITFFLNHGKFGYFGNLSYQHLISRLNSLNPKHITLFNDCCNSGSLIKLFQISEAIEENFQHSSSKEELERIFDNIKQHLTNPNNSDLTKQIIKSMKPGKITKLEYISHLFEQFDYKMSITPTDFLEFKKKSDIFCSSEAKLNSFSFPNRTIQIGRQHVNQAFGSFFISAVLQCLMNPSDADVNPKNFVNHLQNEFNSLKLFKEPLIMQNDSFPSEAEQFFNMDYTKNNLFMITSENFVNFSQLIIRDQNYWNLDHSDINFAEFVPAISRIAKTTSKEVLSTLPNQNIETHTSDNASELSGLKLVQQFANDFAKEVNSELKNEIPNETFNFELISHYPNEEGWDNHSHEAFTLFHFHIIKERSGNMYIPYLYIEKSVINFFIENQSYKNYIEQFKNCFTQAFKKVYQQYHKRSFPATFNELFGSSFH